MKGFRRFVSIAIIGVSGLLIAPPSWAQFITDQTIKLDRTIKLIDAYYVDSVNQDRLVEQAIVEVLKELDPHSTYISKEEVQEMNEPLMGNFEGIGIQFNLLFDTIFVISPISGGPSEKVGIRPGDRIIEIEGENVAGVGITTNGVRDRLLGKKGTKVQVSVKRKGVRGLVDFTITRDKIPIFSMDAAYMVNDRVGYMRFNRFSATTMDEFDDAIKMLQAEGMEDVILDLRSNGGGIFDAAVQMSNEFLEKGQLIVYMQGKKLPRQNYDASGNGRLTEGRLVVMVDEGSASASEIVSGAIQDWDRGLIIGRRTFGKGLVQRPFTLPDQSMIRLTIARYYTPSGRLIQKAYDEGFDAYISDLSLRFMHGEMISVDSIDFPDSLKYKTLTKGRSVYGGGGIMPDIFVPLDTTANFSYYNRMANAGVITNYVLSYVDGHRVELKNKYASFDAFNEDFSVGEEMLEALLSMADEARIERDESSFESSRDQLTVVLKGLIARDLYSMSEYFEVINQEDEVFQKALEVLSGNNPLYSQKLNSR
jgi:carboxyl-terminal processing protease